MNFQELVI
jgi:hypothetical protein